MANKSEHSKVARILCGVLAVLMVAATIVGIIVALI